MSGMKSCCKSWGPVIFIVVGIALVVGATVKFLQSSSSYKHAENTEERDRLIAIILLVMGLLVIVSGIFIFCKYVIMAKSEPQPGITVSTHPTVTGAYPVGAQPLIQPAYPQPGYPMQADQPGYPMQAAQPGYPMQAAQPAYPMPATQPAYPTPAAPPAYPVGHTQPLPGQSYPSNAPQPTAPPDPYSSGPPPSYGQVTGFKS